MDLRAIAMKIFNAPSGVLSSIGIALVSRSRIHQEIERAPVVRQLRHSVENLKNRVEALRSVAATFKSRVETLEDKLREQNNRITELELRLTETEKRLGLRLTEAEERLAAFAQIDELSRVEEYFPDANKKH
jgi:chromosome segregation ATPase